ncbi:hypothetical protein LOK49_LG13G01418 [Camellia lanceoleosa]|uniref:Uncharacterized protein n=1 Tax=Camellia lanceoleosa TaxID=1840588 RepID=A0ACC0FG33_9ERIC|nr:hypothetical protein LOK49_LG13G01418 [Camellia lanceoleosa]
MGAAGEEVEVELGGEVSDVDPTVGAVWVEIGLLRIEENEEEEDDEGESDDHGFGGGHCGDLSRGTERERERGERRERGLVFSLLIFLD